MKPSNLRRLIKVVLEDAGLYSEEAEELLVLTAAAESQGGRYIYQTSGPAKGIFQMEPATERDLILNYIMYKPVLKELLRPYIYFNENGGYEYLIPNPLTYDLAYQVLMARIHYMRDKFGLPKADDTEGLASYWKRVYNTYLGKGKVDVAINKYKTYIAERG